LSERNGLPTTPSTCSSVSATFGMKIL